MRGTGKIVLLRSIITNEDMSIWKANRNFVGEMRIEERFEDKGKRKREKAQFWAFFFFAGLGITPECVCAPLRVPAWTDIALPEFTDTLRNWTLSQRDNLTISQHYLNLKYFYSILPIENEQRARHNLYLQS